MPAEGHEIPDTFLPQLRKEDNLCSTAGVVSPHAMKTAACQKFHRGFTLLEILVAISIIGIVLATILGIFTGIMSSSQNASKRVELYQTGRALMDLICADIRGILPVPTLEKQIFFIGLGASSNDDLESTRMDFVTTHSLPVGMDQNPFLSEVGYRIQKNTADRLLSVWRRTESPPMPPYEEGGRDVPVCRIVESFRLDFISNNDTKLNLSGAVPDAIVVSFTLNLEGEREHFLTMVRPMVKSELGPRPNP